MWQRRIQKLAYLKLIGLTRTIIFRPREIFLKWWALDLIRPSLPKRGEKVWMRPRAVGPRDNLLVESEVTNAFAISNEDTDGLKFCVEPSPLIRVFGTNHHSEEARILNNMKRNNKPLATRFVVLSSENFIQASELMKMRSQTTELMQEKEVLSQSSNHRIEELTTSFGESKEREKKTSEILESLKRLLNAHVP
ncbi:hypothetical protein ACFE04_013420 [Oxalis oulophora]